MMNFIRTLRFSWFQSVDNFFFLLLFLYRERTDRNYILVILARAHLIRLQILMQNSCLEDLQFLFRYSLLIFKST